MIKIDFSEFEADTIMDLLSENLAHDIGDQPHSRQQRIAMATVLARIQLERGILHVKQPAD